MYPLNVYDVDKKEYRHRSGIMFDEHPATREELNDSEDPKVVVISEETAGNVLKGVKGLRTWVECYAAYQEPDENGFLVDDILSLYSFESN